MTTIYKGIYYSRVSGRWKWVVRIRDEKGKWTQHGTYSGENGERNAAIAYDKYLLSQGKQPVNILKLKPKKDNGEQANKA
jgi:hypothetical protein